MREGIGTVGPSQRALARPAGSSDEDVRSYRVMVASLYASPASYILSNVVGALVPLFCAAVTGERLFELLTMTGVTLASARLVMMPLYRRAETRSPSLRQLVLWERLYSLGATAFSLLLGCTSLAAVTMTGDVACHLLTVGSSLAFAALYVARNAARPAFVIVQLGCFCVPTALGLATADTPHYGYLAAFVVFAGLGNVSVTFAINRSLLSLAAAIERSERLAVSLKSKNLTLDTALNSMTHGLCMFGSDLRLEVSNSRFLELYGLDSADVVVGRPLDDIVGALVRASSLTPQTAGDVSELCRRVADVAEPAEREIMAEGRRLFVVSVDTTESGGILMLTEDASARKAAAAQIERMAHCDTLTGLPNRFRFGEVLKASLASPELRKLALFYVDLDNFKLVNDTLGHEAGDQLLIRVAARLEASIGQFGLVGRFGGDEFLILADVSDPDRALEIARCAIEALAEPLEIDGKTLFVTTSLGIAIAPTDGAEPSELMRAADMALYTAKADGRNKAVLYTREIAEALSHRREMELDLREAASLSGRLTLHYQPIVDARTDQVRSYEALMRWMHPEKGMISPVDFIPVAEQTGLIVQMGGWALRQACIDARSWPDPVAVAVNVSAVQFREPAKLIEAVKDALLISGLSPSRLELEVTESLLIADQEATLEAIRVLHRLGVRFSLDDFGSGYSSLAYLARYPFSKVKIDRSFAEHLTSDSESSSRSIIEVVCQLARKLGMRVVVEGIENEAQRREIVALGAEQAQGWLFGRPQAIEQIVRTRREAA